MCLCMKCVFVWVFARSVSSSGRHLTWRSPAAQSQACLGHLTCPDFAETSKIHGIISWRGFDLSFVTGKLKIRNNLRFVLQVAGGLSQHCLKPIVDVIGPLSIPPQGLRLNSDPAISTPPCELWPKMSHFLEIRPHFYILGGTDWLTGSSLIF